MKILGICLAILGYADDTMLDSFKNNTYGAEKILFKNTNFLIRLHLLICIKML